MSSTTLHAQVTNPSSDSSRALKRIAAIDAMRGLAMFFSCLSHFAWWLLPAYPRFGEALIRSGRIATPLFLLLSGAMIGFVRIHDQRVSARARVQLIDRGLFILTIAHVAVAASAARFQHLSAAILSTFATDAVGLACLIVAAFPRHAGRSSIGLIAGGVFVSGWLVALSWFPAAVWLVLLKQLLFGQPDGHTQILSSYVPLIPDVAMCLLGIPLGQWWHRQLATEQGIGTAGKALLRIGAIAMLIALGLRLSRAWASNTVALEQVLLLTAGLNQKIPPSPAYLLFYGGAGLALGGLIFCCWQRNKLMSLIFKLADLGRASLFVFIIQYFVIWTLPDWLGWMPNRYSGALFFTELLGIWLLARVWNSLGGNRWYTLRWYKAAQARIRPH